MACEETPWSRRDLLAGRSVPGVSSGERRHVSGLLVHARPERLKDVQASLEAMPGLDLHGDNPAGKIVATLETLNEDDLVQRLGQIGELPGVLSTALVYHRFD